MKKIAFFLPILFCYEIAYSQFPQYREYLGVDANGLHQYGPGTNFPLIMLAEDFGPRQLDRPSGHDDYDWHGGLDFNAPGGTDANDEGDLILSLEAGTVTTSGVNQTGFKWISIDGNGNGHNISYEHILDDAALSVNNGDGFMVGGCRVKHIDNFNGSDPADNWAIIFHINGIYTAIGPINNSTVTFFDENNVSRTITVTNQVGVGSPIAPIGGSGGFGPHNHMQGMTTFVDGNGNVVDPGASDDKAKNPLEYFAHTSPNYGFDISQDGIPNNGISPVYPGTNRTPLKVRVTLNGEPNANRYPNSIMDVEKIEFKIKNSLETNWRNIKGPEIDRIQFGGTLLTTIMPSGMRTGSINGLGNWTTTGVSPFAYYNHNYDDFFFADFYSRIHKDDPMNGGNAIFANYPWDSRYSDENYEIKTAITRAKANEQWPIGANWSGPVSFEIDNFWPFIRGVNVFYNGTPVYDADYYSQGCQPNTSSCDKLRFTDATYPFPELPTFGGPPFHAPMKMSVLASEALQGTISGKLKDPSGSEYLNPQVQSLDSGKGLLWVFLYDNVLLSINGEYEFEFYGEDKAGNELLNFDTWDGIGNIETVPHQTSAGWAPANPASHDGKSRIYKFKLNNSCPVHFTDDSPSSSFSFDPICDCDAVADFTFAPGGDGLTVNFDASTSSGTEPLTYSWSFGGDGDGTGIMPTHIFSEGGTYVVVLTVTDVCGAVNTAERTMVVSGGSSLNVEINGPNQALPNQEVTFQAVVTGGVPPYTYVWSAVDGGPIPRPNDPHFNYGLHDNVNPLLETPCPGDWVLWREQNTACLA
ncbi:MAG: PKD domain-containing protein [Saprospiraceae bacterium]